MYSYTWILYSYVFGFALSSRGAKSAAVLCPNCKWSTSCGEFTGATGRGGCCEECLCAAIAQLRLSRCRVPVWGPWVPVRPPGKSGEAIPSTPAPVTEVTHCFWGCRWTSGYGNISCLPGTAVQQRRNCLCRTCRWCLLFFFFPLKEKTHVLVGGNAALATHLLELVLLLWSGPVVHPHQGRCGGIWIPQIRIAGGCQGKVCSRRAGGALEGSGWWLLVPVSWVNF